MRVLLSRAVTPAERLYSRLQVKSELTVAELEWDGERDDVGVEGVEEDASDCKSVKSDSHRVDRRGTPSSRLLTPASINRGYRPGGEDEEDTFPHYNDEDYAERAHERGGKSQARETTTSEPIGHAWPVSSERENNSTCANHAHAYQQVHRGCGEYYDASGGRGDPGTFTPTHKDVQVQVILDEPTSRGNRIRGYDRGNDSRSSSGGIIVINSPSRRGDSHRPLDPTQQEQVLLQSRVEALERILALHDSAMQKELTRIVGDTKPSLSNGITSDNDGSGHRTAHLYVKMLSMWREKAVALMVQLRCMELTRSADSSQLREHLAQLEGTCSQLQAQCDVWEQRVKDTEAQRDLQLARVLETEKRCGAANAKAVAAVRTMAVEREKLQRAAELVAVFTAVRSLLQRSVAATGLIFTS